MATITIKGKPAIQVAAAKAAGDMDDYALTRWGCVALDLFEAMREYVQLRTRWLRMSDWVTTNQGHEKWRDRKKQEIAAYHACLGVGGAFDRLAKVRQRMFIAHRQLSEAAIETLTEDYGISMETPDEQFLVALFKQDDITDFLAFLDRWAQAGGGHTKKREDLGECPF